MEKAGWEGRGEKEGREGGRATGEAAGDSGRVAPGEMVGGEGQVGTGQAGRGEAGAEDLEVEREAARAMVGEARGTMPGSPLEEHCRRPNWWCHTCRDCPTISNA